MLALSSSVSRRKQTIPAHNVPEAGRGSTGCSSLLCFLLEHGRALRGRTMGHQSCGKGSGPHSTPTWKGLASVSPVLSPDTSQISALLMGAAANSPASPRKILGNDVELEMPGGTSVQPPQPWRIGPQQHPIYQLLGKSNNTQLISF